MTTFFRSFLLISLLILGWRCSSSSSTYKKKGRTKASAQRVYYINNQRDFHKYKTHRFPAGALILFAQGAIFNGRFAPRGSGTPGHPIVVAAYDRQSKEVYTEDIEEKPILNGHGKVDAPFLLENGAYWEIHNLEITNSNGRRLTKTITDNGGAKLPAEVQRKDAAKFYGIRVIARQNGVTHHIVVSHCYVHDVSEEVTGKRKGGIIFTSYGAHTRFDDVRIEENVVENIDAVGIQTVSHGGSSIRNEKGYNPWTNVAIRGNRVQGTARPGIIVTTSLNPMIEYNMVAYTARVAMGVSIFNFNTRHAVMQYNEVYGNTGGVRERDHCALDADWNSEETVIQYNYSHDNNWFACVQRKYNKGVTIRYNISQNELLGSYYYGFAGAHEAEDIQIYNNTHYFSQGVNGIIFIGEEGYVGGQSSPRIPVASTFKNNIFYFGGQGTIGATPAASTTFDHNLFYHVKSIGTHALTVDPLFKNPGAGGTDIDMHAQGRLAGYQLQAVSPAIDAGIKIDDNGGKDFGGRPLYNRAPDLGAYEAQ